MVNQRRKKAPNLSLWNRLWFGFLTAFLNPKRLNRIGIIIKPAMLLKFHKALIRRKYRALFSNKSNAYGWLHFRGIWLECQI